MNYHFDIECFIEKKSLSKNSSEIIRILNTTMLSYPMVVCLEKFSLPFYYKNTWVSYLNPIKKNGIEFCVVRANEIPSIHEFINFENRKQVAGIKFYHPEDIKSDIVHYIFQEALQLDTDKPYSFTKKK